VVVEEARIRRRMDRLDLTTMLRNVQAPSHVTFNFQYPIFNDQQTCPGFTNGTNIAMKKTNGIKMHNFFIIWTGVILEKNEIASINKK
jgi:hypothetical protein